MKILRSIIAISIVLTSIGTAHAAGISVFAAASMKTALDQIVAVWTEKTSAEITVTYSSSATLAKQIEQAAPADIFISADLAWMDELAKKHLIKSESRKNLVGNTLVLIEAKGANLDSKIENLSATLGDEKIALGDVKSVPAGKYAKAALENLNLWAAIEPHIVMQENVRSALALVARGEAKLGIVYASDAKSEVKVDVLAIFPDSTHAKIIYPAALISASKNTGAQSFLDFLSSADAQLIFVQNGFTLLK